MVIHVRLCIAMLRRTGEEQLPNDVKSTNTTKIAMTFSGILLCSIGTFSLLGKDCVSIIIDFTKKYSSPYVPTVFRSGTATLLLQLEHSVTQDTLTVKVLRPIYQLYNLEIKRNAIAK